MKTRSFPMALSLTFFLSLSAEAGCPFAASNGGQPNTPAVAAVPPTSALQTGTDPYGHPIFAPPSNEDRAPASADKVPATPADPRQ